MRKLLAGPHIFQHECKDSCEFINLHLSSAVIYNDITRKLKPNFLLNVRIAFAHL